MKIAKWAPSTLVEKYKELKPKADREARWAQEHKAANRPIPDWKTSLESNERLCMGTQFPGHLTQLKLLNGLITKTVMADVWKNLERRQDSFKPAMSLFGGRDQARNLFGACVEAEIGWINLPKRTKAESKKLHEDIAAVSLQLCGLLVEVLYTSDFSDTRRYIEKEKLKDFMEALAENGCEIWPGFNGYLDELLSGLLPAVPKILLTLQKQALKEAQNPHAVRQPHSPSAKTNFFIDALSSYFKQAYGTPLHAHVAAITTALFDEDIGEDRVRALLRSRKAASKSYARKKVAEIKREIAG
jgi:hypothetical protein